MQGIPTEHFHAVVAVLAHASALTGAPVRLELGRAPAELSPGDRGDAVRRLQRALIDAGEPLPRYGVDGHFGPETLGALRRLARRVGLVGTLERLTPEAWAALFGPAEALDVELGSQGVRLTMSVRAPDGWKPQATDRIEGEPPAILAEAAAALLRSGE